MNIEHDELHDGPLVQWQTPDGALHTGRVLQRKNGDAIQSPVPWTDYKLGYGHWVRESYTGRIVLVDGKLEPYPSEPIPCPQ